MKNFIDALEELKITSSTNKKMAIIEDFTFNKDDNQLLLYLTLALDDRITFGIKEFKDLPKILLDEKYVHTDDTGEISNFETFQYICEAIMNKKEIGNKAQQILQAFFDIVTPKEAEWYKRCILKDMSIIGMGASLVNKAIGDKFILDFKCSGAMDQKNLDKMVYPANAELKKNGIRALFFTDENGEVDIPPFNKNITCIGRSGLPIDNFNFIIPEINKLGLCNKVLDGEISVEDNLWETQTLSSFKFRPKSEFLGKNGKLKEKAYNDYLSKENEVLELQSRAKYTLFEVLDKREFNNENIKNRYSCRRIYLTSLDIISKTNKINIVPAIPVNSKEEAIEVANRWIDEGFEGAVIKSHDGKYGFTKGPYAIKIKRDIKELDAMIIDIIDSKPTYTTTGELDKIQAGTIIIQYNSPVTEQVVRSGVGTGIALDKRTKEDMAANKDQYIGLIVEVNGTEFSPDGVLICPRINRIRLPFDKMKLE